MKYLLLIISLALYGTLDAQTFPRGLPSPFSNGYSKIGYDQADSGRIDPVRDTNWTPSKVGMTVIRPVTFVKYLWTGVKWIKLNSDGVYNIKDFGAKSDGTTNDATAIQNTLNVGTYVFIPEGTTMVGAQLNIQSNQVIFGVGAGSVLKASVNDLTILKATSVHHFTVKDIAVDGGGQTTNLLSGIRGTIAMRLDGAQHFSVENVTVYKCGIMDADPMTDGVKGGFGIIVESISSSSAYGTITNCNISYIAGGGMFRGDGIYIGSQNASAAVFTHDIYITKCAVSTVGRHCYTVATGTSSVPEYIYFSECYGDKAALCGIDVEPGKNVYIQNSNFQKCGNDQYYYNPVDIDEYGATYGLLAGISSTNANENMNIINCTFDNCYYAITYGNTNKMSIINSTAKNSTVADLYQFLAGAPTEFTIKDCKFLSTSTITSFYYTLGETLTGAATNCIFSGTLYAALANNFRFNNCTFKKGFRFSGTDQSGIVFDNCTFTDFAGDGISFPDINSKITDVTVRNCKFLGTGNMRFGIKFLFHDAERWTVDNNEFSGQDSAGIYHANGDSVNVFISCSGNTFKSSPYGIWINQAITGGNISGNQFYNITGYCLRISLIILNVNLTNTIITNNVAIKNCTNGFSIETPTGIWDYCTVTGNNFRSCSGTKWSVPNGNLNGITANNIY